MKPQTGPSSKDPISIDQLHEAVADLSNKTQICTLISPIGIQAQFFYDDFALEKAIYSHGVETIDITHIIYQSLNINQYAMSSFIQDNCPGGVFDIFGVVYISFDSISTINRFRTMNNLPPFKYFQNAVQHILTTGEYAEELRFTPNWSNTLTLLICLDTYAEFLEVLSEDFQQMDFIICTPKTIENTNKIKQDAQHIQNGKDKADFPINSIILFNNDISKVKYFSSPETNVIAEVTVDKHPDTIMIEAIEAEPNRYGRIRPVISSDEITRYETEFYTIELPTMHDLAKSNYEVGDVVEVEFFNKRPKLGRIIKKTKTPHKSPLINTVCPSCGKELVYKSSQLYCETEFCASSVLDKIVYANSKRVLDLPFNWHTIHDLVMLKGCVTDIPSIFNLDRQTLNTLFDTDFVDFILKVLRTRIAQLNGDGFKADVQNIAQGRFLDALSIVGLHSQNIKRLRRSLADGDWQWSELPLVLTDRGLLKSFEIPDSNTYEIVRSARSKITELDTLVREF